LTCRPARSIIAVKSGHHGRVDMATGVVPAKHASMEDGMRYFKAAELVSSYIRRLDNDEVTFLKGHPRERKAVKQSAQKLENLLQDDDPEGDSKQLA
jgi:hypothetical protein